LSNFRFIFTPAVLSTISLQESDIRSYQRDLEFVPTLPCRILLSVIGF